jgi:hypothetical protein
MSRNKRIRKRKRKAKIKKEKKKRVKEIEWKCDFRNLEGPVAGLV